MKFLSTNTIYNAAGEPYLKQYDIFSCRWFGVKIHHILLPDWARDLHDHPWWFMSFVLRGWYQEEIPPRGPPLPRWAGPCGTREIRSINWFNSKQAGGLHRITLMPRRGVWTLFINGPRVREWGFQTADGWVGWKEYHKAGRRG